MVGGDHFKIRLFGGGRGWEARLETVFGCVKLQPRSAPISSTVLRSTLHIFSPTRGSKSTKILAGLSLAGTLFGTFNRVCTPPYRTGCRVSSCIILILHIPFVPSTETSTQVITSPRDLNCRNKRWGMEKSRVEYRVCPLLHTLLRNLSRCRVCTVPMHVRTYHGVLESYSMPYYSKCRCSTLLYVCALGYGSVMGRDRARWSAMLA